MTYCYRHDPVLLARWRRALRFSVLVGSPGDLRLRRALACPPQMHSWCRRDPLLPMAAVRWLIVALEYAKACIEDVRQLGE
jgi:hypothetical protein